MIKKSKILLSVLACCILITGIFLNFTLQSIFTKKSVSQSPYLMLPQVLANGHALTWDGRVSIQTNLKYMSRGTTYTGAVIASFDPGFTLKTNQSVSYGEFTFAMQGDGNLVLYKQNKPVFASDTSGKCDLCSLIYQGDGNLVLYNDRTGRPIWTTSTSNPQDKLIIGATEPYILISDSTGKMMWPKDNVVVWSGRVFRPESLSTIDAENISSLEANFQSAFSPDVNWAVGEKDNLQSNTSLETLNLSMLNALAIVPDANYQENPYRSDAKGNFQEDGTFETYKTRIFTQYYGKGLGDNPMGFFPATIIVANAHTTSATISSIKSDGKFQTMKDKKGNLIHAIEPTVTVDGKLVVYQEWNSTGFTGDLFFTYHDNDLPDYNDWSEPAPITDLHKYPKLALRYPIARAPFRDADGNILTRFPGAYPWLSLNGEDILYAGSIFKDGARRAGTSIAGSSSKWMTRLLDGGVNTARYGGFHRLFTSSLGRTPGMWSPLEFNEKGTFPITDKLFTYLIYASNAALYFEASFEETVDGNYDVYYDMVEKVNPFYFMANLGNYETNKTQDTSGFFHVGTKNENALYTEEAFPTTCTNLNCPEKDSRSTASNLFSGQPMYFKGNGYFYTPATSATGHTILAGTSSIGVGFAIRPMDITESANILAKGETLTISTDENLNIKSTFTVKNGSLVTKFSVYGPKLDQGVWNHIFINLDLKKGTFNYYKNGALLSTTVVKTSGTNFNLGTDILVVGPSTSSNPGIMYALDQVGISRILRSNDEIRRQAGLTVNRNLKSSITLPLGLKTKDMKSDLLGRSLNSNVRELGRHLFFDKRLSRGNNISCATCHTPDNAFAEPVSLHDSLLASSGGPAKILRNTPSVLNLAFKSRFMAEGRHPRLIDQALNVLTNPEEMGSDTTVVVNKLSASSTYVQLFSKAWPGKNINANMVATALEEFQLSLVSGNSRFDQYKAGTLTALNDGERKGMKLFFGKARCAECHSGSNFTDNSFHKLGFVSTVNEVGTADEGLFRITGQPQDKGRFATPSLRNIALTAPYFHNGSVNSLKEVVALYNSAEATDDSLTGIFLSGSEEDDLVSFLETLTGDIPKIAEPVFTDMPAPLPSSQTFGVGEGLAADKKIEFANSILRFSSGSLQMVDSSGKILWNTGNIGCDSTCRLVYQGDGNLVIYKGSQAVWNTATVSGENRGSSFVVSDQEPYLKVLTSNGSIAWASSSAFAPGFSLKPGQFAQIGTVSSELKLKYQTDGNLVLYEGSGPSQKALWNTGIGRDCSTNNCSAVFQSDFNFVLYDKGTGYWQSRTNGKPKSKLYMTSTSPYLRIQEDGGQIHWFTGLSFASFNLKTDQSLTIGNLFLVMQVDGNLVLYNNKTSSPLWSSQTSGNDCRLNTCSATFAGGNLNVRIGDRVVFYKNTFLPSGLFQMNQKSPNLRIINPQGSLEWINENVINADFELTSDQYVKFGDVITKLTMVMQPDGNLVVYQKTNNGEKALWSTETYGEKCGINCRATFQANGSLVLYSGTKPYWSSNSESKLSSRLNLSTKPPYL
jgi:cytochrome c peroxidase